ncbi:MAG: ferredoxin-type protein NapF, partial [Gammaproteobacteria bacterium]|nr:ferredoxin-type protein NapF [Gammaproteobacteria bacterium]
DDFVARCTRCSDCLTACPTTILEKGRGGFPLVNFARGECTFCGKCVEVCKPAALVRDRGAAPWTIKASIGDACLALQRVVCRSCGDRCEARAIRFRLAPGGVSRPELDGDTCNGCGACVAVCPASAITICEAAGVAA